MKLRPWQSTRRRDAAGLTWPLLVVLLAVATAVGLAWWKAQELLREKEVMARVGDVEIKRPALAEALRARVWREGLEWEKLDEAGRQRLREATLNELVQDQLLLANRVPAEVAPAVAEGVFQEFLKQFEQPDAWNERAAWQGFQEMSLRAMLGEDAGVRQDLELRLHETMQPVSDETARRWFAQNKGRFRLPERVLASHILLTRHNVDKPDREPQIREMRRRLLSGEATFTALATRESEDPRSKKKNGDLGWFSRERVPPIFAEVVFAMSPGQMSEPFLSELGWHIVLLREKRPAREATYDEIKDEILAHLNDESRRQALEALMIAWQEKTPVKIVAEHLESVDPSP